MIDPRRAGDITRPGTARRPFPPKRPAGASGGPSPEGIQLKVLSGAGVPAYYAYAHAYMKLIKVLRRKVALEIHRSNILL